MNKKIVVIGLSGGVDSAIAAYLLKQQNYHVIGLFMQNWDSALNFETNYTSTNGSCDAQIDYEDALKVANHLNIPLYRIEFINEYWNNVFSYFIDEYKKNRTPNPDILCNKYIKFDAFLSYAIQTFNCDYIAMGHYAGVYHANNCHFLTTAKDIDKDQTYFLAELTQEQLKKVIFPLTNLTKNEVREIAKKINLPNALKKDSTGICFIGERKFRDFLSNYLPSQPGNIIDITNNKIVGKHNGVMYYTLGQRKGLNLGGLKERYFVCKKDITNKVIYVAPNSYEDLYLKTNQIIIRNFNWIYQPNNFDNIYARFRHRQEYQPVLIQFQNNELIVNYPCQKNIVPGQYCVLYKNNICLGGGKIDIAINNTNKK